LIALLCVVRVRRLVAAITCLAFTGSVAFAQVEPPAPPPPPGTPQQEQSTHAYPPQQQQTYASPPQQPNPARTLPSPEQLYRSGRREQAVGVLLTFLGIGIGVLGLGLLNDSQNPDRSFGDAFGKALLGGLFSLIGVGSFVSGVALWVHGDLKMSDALQMGASGTTLAPTPRVATAPGLTLQWRF